MEGGPVGAQIRELYARLQGLRERAETARSKRDASYSQNTVQIEVQASGQPRVEQFRGKRISDWAPQDPNAFKVPQADSDDLVLALVAVWSKWASETVDERWWRNQLERARTERAQERHGEPVPEEEPDSRPLPETLSTVGAASLEVHPAVLPAPGTGPGSALPVLTPYLLRTHDSELRKALSPALAGGPSILTVLTGDSSTGKTRALYEALLYLAPNRPLLRPHSAEDLLGLLRANQVTAGVVLWLNETQRFLYGQDGERAAAELLRLLEHQPGVAVVGSLWHDPYWSDLTRQGVPGDPHSHARALLTAPATRRIPVASGLSDQDQTRWRELARRQEDPRLADALDAGAVEGHVVQHLSGGPELLAAYLHGPDSHFTPVEHALLTAALDAHRLGHRTPLPAALLADAADGALAQRDRPGDPAWADLALDALSTGERLDGSRTDIRRALTAMTALRTRSGTLPQYEPADYLDQHTRRLRADQLGTPSLWQALLDHTTDPEDLHQIADSAWNRALYKQAVLLWRKAILAGHPNAPAVLVASLTDTGLDPHHQAAGWIVAHADITSPEGVSRLLWELREAGASEATAELLDRDPAAHADLTNPYSVARLVEELQWAGEGEAVLAVGDRAARQVHLTNADAVATLLQALREARAGDAVTVLLNRDPGAHTDLTKLDTGASLLKAMREAGAGEAMEALAQRAAAHADLTNPYSVARLVEELQWAGEGEAVLAVGDRAARQVHLTNADAVATLLQALREAGAGDAVTVLLNRDPGAHTDLTKPDAADRLVRQLGEAGAKDAAATLNRAVHHAGLTNAYAVLSSLVGLRMADAREAMLAVAVADPYTVARLPRDLWKADTGEAMLAVAHHADLTDQNAVARLLRALREVGAGEAMETLAHRAASQVKLNDADAVARLLEVMREAGAGDAVTVLLNRDPAAHTDLTGWYSVAQLLEGLRNAGAGEAMDALADRALNAGVVSAQAGRFGRETGGQPAAPWTWSDLEPHR